MTLARSNTISVVSLVLLLVVVGLFAFGWWYNNNNYTEQYERNFMANCNATSGGNSAGCACAYMNLKSQYSFAEAREFESNPSSFETREAFQKIAQQCS